MAILTFRQFMKRCDLVIQRVSGLGVYDFADATWRDLYDELGDDCTDTDVCECLAEWDDIFSQMYELYQKGDDKRPLLDQVYQPK
jgi:hypothetical protein